MNKLKIAIQKNGRLSDKSMALLKNGGLSFPNGERKLIADASNAPYQILFLRDDDIPEYIENGVADIGILGLNVVQEQQKNIAVIKSLGFAKCRLSIALPTHKSIDQLALLNGLTIATSHPFLLQQFLAQNQLNCKVEALSGSVEIATGIGLADAICDIVSTGSTLISNGLSEKWTIMQSEAVMVANTALCSDKTVLLNDLLFRINAVISAEKYKYILLNAPNENLLAIQQILPGMKSPSVLPLALPGWSSVHSVITESDFWEKISLLKQAGAEGILVLPIEKMMP